AGDIDVHIVGHSGPRRKALQRTPRSAIARSRRIAGWIMAVVLPLALTGVFVMLGNGEEMLIVNILSYMAAEVAVALMKAEQTAAAGGTWAHWKFICAMSTCFSWSTAPWKASIPPPCHSS
ncbi:hypothetical protein CJ199_14140, partial [Brevibacterium paucivorans]